MSMVARNRVCRECGAKLGVWKGPCFRCENANLPCRGCGRKFKAWSGSAYYCRGCSLLIGQGRPLPNEKTTRMKFKPVRGMEDDEKREYVYCERCTSSHDPREGRYCAVCVLVAVGDKVSAERIDEMSRELILSRALGGMFRAEMERIARNKYDKPRANKILSGGPFGMDDREKPGIATIRTPDEALAEAIRINGVTIPPALVVKFAPYGSCSICKVAFGRTTAKADVDGTQYCFPCWDELKRTGTVARYKRPVAPELYPEPPAVKLVEMRPKRLIKMEE